MMVTRWGKQVGRFGFGFGFGSDGSGLFNFFGRNLVGPSRINLHVVFFQIFDKFRFD
jgi:hypothetical protein